MRIPTAEEVRNGTRKEFGEVELVVLDGAATKTNSWSNVRTLRGSVGQIKLAKFGDTLFPARKKPAEERKNDNLVDMTIAFESPTSAPGIKLGYTIRKGRSAGRTAEATHSGSVVFYFSQLKNHQTNTSYRGIVRGSLKASVHEPDSAIDGDFRFTDLEFRSEGAVANNLQPPADMELSLEESQMIKYLIQPPADMELSLEESQMIKYLKEFVNPDREHVVKLRMTPFPADNDKHEVELLNNSDAKTQESVLLNRWGAFDTPMAPRDSAGREAFANYKRTNLVKGNTTEVKIAYNNQKSRYDVVTAVPYVPIVSMPVYANFIDCVHAEIALGYGEFSESKRHLLSLQRNEHTCGILSIGESAVIGVKFTITPKMGFSQDEKFSLPPNTKVELAISTGRQDDDIKVQGMTMDNTLGLAHADIVVLVTGRDAQAIRKDGNWHARHGLRLGKRHKCRVTAAIKESVIKAQLDAVTKAYDPQRKGGRGNELLPMLMFNGVGDCPVTEPFEQLPHPSAARTHLNNAAHWNLSQRTVIDGSQKLTGGLQLITSCAGTGKTLIIREKATAAVKGGAYVMVSSERNTVVDNLADSLAKSKHLDEFSVVRVYASVQSIGEIVREHNPEDAKKDVESDSKKENDDSLDLEGERCLYEILEAKAQDRKLKTRGRPEFAVKYHIMENVKNGVNNMAGFTSGIDENGNPKRHPDHPTDVDMFKYFGDFMAETKTHPLSEMVDPTATRIFLAKPGPMPESTDKVKYWDKDALDLVKQAMICNRRFVIKHADIVLTTVGNCASDEVRQCFAPDTERKVFLEIDEALTITEASILIPMTKLNACGRIVSICQYGDVKQLGPVVLGTMGSFNADWPGLNEFGPQIRVSQMVRLHRAGFYCFKLNEQARMAPDIFEAANQMFYGCEVKTTTENRAYDLPNGYEAILREFATYPPEVQLTGPQERLLWLGVPGDSMRVSPSGSKGNYRLGAIPHCL